MTNFINSHEKLHCCAQGLYTIYKLTCFLTSTSLFTRSHHIINVMHCMLRYFICMFNMAVNMCNYCKVCFDEYCMVLGYIYVTQIISQCKDCIQLYIYIYIYMVQNTYVIIIPRIGYEIIAQSC